MTLGRDLHFGMAEEYEYHALPAAEGEDLWEQKKSVYVCVDVKIKASR